MKKIKMKLKNVLLTTGFFLTMLSFKNTVQADLINWSNPEPSRTNSKPEYNPEDLASDKYQIVTKHVCPNYAEVIKNNLELKQISTGWCTRYNIVRAINAFYPSLGKLDIGKMMGETTAYLANSPTEDIIRKRLNFGANNNDNDLLQVLKNYHVKAEDLFTSDFADNDGKLQDWKDWKDFVLFRNNDRNEIKNIYKNCEIFNQLYLKKHPNANKLTLAEILSKNSEDVRNYFKTDNEFDNYLKITESFEYLNDQLNVIKLRNFSKRLFGEHLKK